LLRGEIDGDPASRCGFEPIDECDAVGFDEPILRRARALRADRIPEQGVADDDVCELVEPNRIAEQLRGHRSAADEGKPDGVGRLERGKAVEDEEILG
jgi:hypothetical protein